MTQPETPDETLRRHLADLRRNRNVEAVVAWMREHLSPAEVARELAACAHWQRFFSPEANAARLREQLEDIELKARAAEAVANREARWRAEGGDE